MFVIAVLSVIASYASQLLVGVVIGIIVTLMFRDDLTAQTIASYGATDPTLEIDDADELLTAENRTWTVTAESLTDACVPASVALQVLVNRVREFQAKRLLPLEKRLEKVGRLLSAAVRAKRQAWTAHKYRIRIIL